MPGSFLREQYRGTGFPHFRFAGENSSDRGSRPTPHSFGLTGPTPCPAPHHCSRHNCKRHLLHKSTSLGLSFCPVTNSKPRLLHLASQTPWWQTTPAHNQYCTGANWSQPQKLRCPQTALLTKPQAISSIFSKHQD